MKPLPCGRVQDKVSNTENDDDNNNNHNFQPQYFTNF